MNVAASREPRRRHSGYAERLFDRRPAHPRRAARGPASDGRRPLWAGRAAVRSDRSRAPRRARNRRWPAAAAAAGLSLVVLLHGGRPQARLEEQRPDPAEYRVEIDLVSIDRVGTMFHAVVSQGFFLQPADEQRRAVERLVRKVAARGFESVYLVEASGRAVAWWSGSVLHLLPPSAPGS
jgi:hypothetical protein